MVEHSRCITCGGTGRRHSIGPDGQTSSACLSCAGTGSTIDMGKTMAEARRQHPEPSRPGPDVPIYIWFFGALGALFGGLAKPWGLAWPLAAFFGFVAAGVIAGVLNNYRIGRYILIAIGVDVIALFGAAIILEAR